MILGFLEINELNEVMTKVASDLNLPPPTNEEVPFYYIFYQKFSNSFLS
jgi:hypothetical protein